MERARAVRDRSFADTTLRSYRADARGYVYFFLDRPGSAERTPVKTDQIALEIFWEAPDRTHQRIVGRRDERLLPTNIKYHLDHLTVVQDEFPDRIRLGDGDEVADVTHPVAPGAEGVYDFRLADSLTISLPGGADPVRVYEVRVRPRHMDLPGFIGSVFLDRATGAIVRMRFTFTPASYVDPYLDYIRISLDNLLWEGEHWLPYRQVAELRRELPQLDFAAGSIIRGRFEIGPYAFDEPLPPGLFQRGRVSTVPADQLAAFEFEDSLHAELEREGLGTPASLDEIRDQAREVAGDRYLSGLRRLRLRLPSASRLYRHDRAEGHVVGAGWSYALTADFRLAADGGWSFGRERGTGTLELRHGREPRKGLELYAHLPRDIGPLPGASTVVNTLGSLLYDSDWTDPYFASGIRLWVEWEGRDGPWWVPNGVTASLGLERQRTATAVVSDGERYRPVRPVREGDQLVSELAADWGGGVATPEGWGARLETRRGTGVHAWIEGLDYDRTLGSVAWGRTESWRALDVSVRLDGGWTSDSAPQALFLLGGRGTLLGHDFRRYVGDRFWLARAEVSRTVAAPWLSVGAQAAAGQAELDAALPDGWTGDPKGGVKGSVGAGVGLFWDILEIDVGRGIGAGGGWEVAFGVARRFHAWL